jgi:hypothetical protein
LNKDDVYGTKHATSTRLRFPRTFTMTKIDSSNDSTMAAQSAEAPNAYLLMREEKIARNKARLLELGLTKESNKTNVAKATRPKSTSTSNVASQMSQPVRRSKRVLNDKNGSTLDVDSTYIEKKRKVTRLADQNAALLTGSEMHSKTKTSSQEVAHALNSARSISINIQDFLFGDPHRDLNESPGYLGRQVAATKAVVMERSCLAASNYDGDRISFNKYSGVQEWAGNVLYLWVNLGAPHSDVANEFLENGRHVSWFGGARMHSESPVIAKLRQKDAQIVLFCREYAPVTKTFGSYVCFGRLQVSLYCFNQSDLPLEMVGSVALLLD